MNGTTNIGINTSPMRAFYPSASGPSQGTEANPATSDKVSPANALGEVATAAAVGTTGNPLLWWVALVVLLVGFMFAVRHLGGESAKSDFANIRPGVYNILIISLAAIIGINFWKVVFTRFKVPGLSTIVLST